jgi:hypothetical protein
MLTGANIDESTLGQVPDSQRLGGVDAGLFPTRRRVAQEFSVTGVAAMPIGGVGIFTFACPNSPATGTKASFKNESSSPVDVFIDDSAAVGTTRYTKDLAAGATVSTGIDPATDAVRNVTLRVLNPAGSHTETTLDVAMIRNSSGTLPCRFVGTILD